MGFERYSFQISADGSYLAFGSQDHHLRILDVREVSARIQGAKLLYDIVAHEGPVKVCVP